MDNNPPANMPPSGRKKMLIVENDFFIRDLYALQARKAGFDVVMASDGQEALTKAEAETPDLILMDLMLPKIDGITAMKNIKANPKLVNIPCVLVTNLEDSIKEQEARAAGAAAYLLKIKNTPDMVISAVQKLLK